MEALSISAISLTLDCDHQQKNDDDPASGYDIFCFHYNGHVSAKYGEISLTCAAKMGGS